MQWYKIETAPKDGTKILTFNGSDIYILLYILGSWCEPANMMQLRKQPTHWQPLPELPEEAK